MVRCHHHSLLSLLPFQVHLPMHFKPTIFSQHTPLNVTYLWNIKWTTQKENKSSVYPFKQTVIFPSRNPPQKYCIANRPTILYLDSKTTIYLNNHLSHSNNPHAPHTAQNRQVIHHSQDDRAKKWEYNVWYLSTKVGRWNAPIALWNLAKATKLNYSFCCCFCFKCHFG